MDVTPKQEKFAQCVADGMTQADAYRTAYDASKMLDKTIVEAASRLAAECNVAARIATLKQQLSTKALWTREDSVRALAAIAAAGGAKAGEIVAAIKELNAMHGFNEPSKLELSGQMITAVERRIVRPEA